MQSWPAWILAAVAAVAASRIANGGVFGGDASTSGIGLFFGPHHHRNQHGLPPLGPLATSFLLVFLGAAIGSAAVIVGLVRGEPRFSGRKTASECLVAKKGTRRRCDEDRTKNSTSFSPPPLQNKTQVFLLFFATETVPDVTEADARSLADALESEARKKEAEEPEERRREHVVLRGTEDEAATTSSPAPSLPPPIPFAALAAELRAATAASRRPRPPHPHARRGCYGGWVWTVPAASIPPGAPAAASPSWPPPTEKT